jgi:hypothetical protein
MCSSLFCGLTRRGSVRKRETEDSIVGFGARNGHGSNRRVVIGDDDSRESPADQAPRPTSVKTVPPQSYPFERKLNFQRTECLDNLR